MMSDDARFEDAASSSLRIVARDANDLKVVSALVQDSVFTAKEISRNTQKRQIAFLLSRFRWEDKEQAELEGRDYERVRSVLLICDVLAVDFHDACLDRDSVYSLLSLGFLPGDDGMGRITATISGDCEIAIDVECVEVILSDVTRPYLARARKAPSHE